MPGLNDNPFHFRELKNARVQISHHGKIVTTLGGAQAKNFLAKAQRANTIEQQHLMARATGHYKHGNERRST